MKKVGIPYGTDGFFERKAASMVMILTTDALFALVKELKTLELR